MRNYSQIGFHDLLAPPDAVEPGCVQLSSYAAMLARNKSDIENAKKRARRAELSAADRAIVKEGQRARDAARYERDQEKLRLYQKKYYRKNRVKILAGTKLKNRQNGYASRSMLYSAAKRAAKKGWEFNLDFSDVQVPEVCPILGIPLIGGSDVRNQSRDCNPSLDRIDNENGYIKGNVRVISLRANRLKSDATLAEIEAIVAYMRGPSK